MSERRNEMHTQMHAHGADLIAALQTYIERRIRFALGRFATRVGQVTVRVKTEGKLGNQCRISADLLPFGQVAVEDSDIDLFAAIDRATGKIGRQFGRELERIRHRPGRDSIRLSA